MEAGTCLETRRSVRHFTAEPVARADVEEMVRLASLSPSWKNCQPVRYILVEDPALKSRIARDCVLGFAGNTDNILGAPALMLLTVINGRSGFERDGSPTTAKGAAWESFDAGIAAQSFCLAAHTLGYGTVIMGIFDDAALAAAASVPAGQTVAAMIALGHPAESPAAPRRKPVEELLSLR